MPANARPSAAPAYEIVAHAHNALAVTEPLEAILRPYYGRPYRVIRAERFSSTLTSAIRDPQILRVITDSGLSNAVGQFADSVGILQHAQQFRKLGDFLGD